MGTFWCLQPFLRKRDSKNLKNDPLPLILGKYCPDCSVQHLFSIPSLDKYFKRILTRVKTFLRFEAPLWEPSVEYTSNTCDSGCGIHVDFTSKVAL